MLYRVALRGFAEGERRSLASFLDETRDREPAYELVGAIENADVILADGDVGDVVASVIKKGQLASTLFLSEATPSLAKWHAARPTDPQRLLQGLDGVVASLHPDSSVARAVLDAHARAKAAARRARLSALARSIDPVPIPPDILVLDRDDTARDELCALLEHFGFCSYPARNTTQATWLLETRPFRAVFLDIDLDESDDGLGVELCQRVRNDSRLTLWPSCALFIVADSNRPTDRVRAVLAGCNQFLLRPLGRGDVARALEACGIRLPADDRRT